MSLYFGNEASADPWNASTYRSFDGIHVDQTNGDATDSFPYVSNDLQAMFQDTDLYPNAFDPYHATLGTDMQLGDPYTNSGSYDIAAAPYESSGSYTNHSTPEMTSQGTLSSAASPANQYSNSNTENLTALGVHHVADEGYFDPSLFLMATEKTLYDYQMHSMSRPVPFLYAGAPLDNGNTANSGSAQSCSVSATPHAQQRRKRTAHDMMHTPPVLDNPDRSQRQTKRVRRSESDRVQQSSVAEVAHSSDVVQDYWPSSAPQNPSWRPLSGQIHYVDQSGPQSGSGVQGSSGDIHERDRREGITGVDAMAPPLLERPPVGHFGGQTMEGESVRSSNSEQPASIPSAISGVPATHHGTPTIRKSPLNGQSGTHTEALPSSGSSRSIEFHPIPHAKTPRFVFKGQRALKEARIGLQTQLRQANKSSPSTPPPSLPDSLKRSSVSFLIPTTSSRKNGVHEDIRRHHPELSSNRAAVERHNTCEVTKSSVSHPGIPKKKKEIPLHIRLMCTSPLARYTKPGTKSLKSGPNDRSEQPGNRPVLDTGGQVTGSPTSAAESESKNLDQPQVTNEDDSKPEADSVEEADKESRRPTLGTGYSMPTTATTIGGYWYKSTWIIAGLTPQDCGLEPPSPPTRPTSTIRVS